MLSLGLHANDKPESRDHVHVAVTYSVRGSEVYSQSTCSGAQQKHKYV